MSELSDSREQEIAQALRQLATDHQQGRLSLASYRRLRHRLLDSVDTGKDILQKPKAGRARPGLVVIVAVAAIVFLLVMVGLLLR